MSPYLVMKQQKNCNEGEKGELL